MLRGTKDPESYSAITVEDLDRAAAPIFSRSSGFFRTILALLKIKGVLMYLAAVEKMNSKKGET